MCKTDIYTERAMPWFTQLVAGLLLQRPELIRRPVHVGFVVEELGMVQVFVSFLQPSIHIQSSYRKFCMILISSCLKIYTECTLIMKVSALYQQLLKTEVNGHSPRACVPTQFSCLLQCIPRFLHH